MTRTYRLSDLFLECSCRYTKSDIQKLHYTFSDQGRHENGSIADSNLGCMPSFTSVFYNLHV